VEFAKKKSIILFFAGIFFLLASIILLFFVAQWFMYGVFSFIAFGIAICLWETAYETFGNYTQYYPLNSLQEYKISIKYENDIISYGDFDAGVLTIEIIREGDMWLLSKNEKKLKIDLTGYPYQKQWVLGFFIRQFNFVEINKRKLPFKKVHKSLTLSWLYKINDVIIILREGKQFTKHQIVKNKKINRSLKEKFVLNSYFVLQRGFSFGKTMDEKYHQVSEDFFRNYCKTQTITKNQGDGSLIDN